MEMLTYRYKGHSMSDPGVSYRKKEEVKEMEEQFDPITMIQKTIIDNELATVEELSKIDEDLKHETEEAVKFALESPEPPKEELFRDINVERIPIRGRDSTERY